MWRNFFSVFFIENGVSVIFDCYTVVFINVFAWYIFVYEIKYRSILEESDTCQQHVTPLHKH